MPLVVATIAARGDKPHITQVPCSAPDIAGADDCQPRSGVYAAFATQHGRRVVRLSRHLDRLEESAERIGFAVKLNRDLVRTEIRQLIDDAGLQEAKVRVVWDPANDPDTLNVAAEAYAGPPPEKRDGVSCETVTHIGRANAEVKQSAWLATRKTLRSTHRENAFDYLLVDDGVILEGSTSNFYAVYPGTPPTIRTAADQVLVGIARSIVLEVAPDAGRLELLAPNVADLPSIAEAFLTSSTRGVVPIVAIDDYTIGGGHPGPVTTRISELYDHRARDLEESL